MKTFSSIFVHFASIKLIPRYSNLSLFDNISSSDIIKFTELQRAFCLGVRFREEFSNSSVKAKKKFCRDFPMSDIYTDFLKSFFKL